MLSEEVHAAIVADREKIVGHEDAAHEKRNWVRLTFDCNNRCIFCLDSDTHDGEIRDRDEVREQILDGRRKGATRLILSGGEPTIHPNYVDFIRLGSRAGYTKIQTVTNGRMFQYQEFLDRCLDAGLTELTFSLHGPNPRIHDALVGVKGAFEHETAGLKKALADGRPVVNVDIVINRANVKHLTEMLDLFISWGVREFDLLQVVPFGRAFTEGRDTLFYNLEEMRPYLLAAFAYSRRPDLHIWLNRFPPQHLEGYEHLIQDPYKLNDEVRGRKEEFTRLLDEGVDLDCRDEHGRCTYCYLEKLCNTLYGVRQQVRKGDFEVVRIDTEWEAHQTPVFGGDPASARRARDEAARLEALRAEGGMALPSLTADTAAQASRVPGISLPSLGLRTRSAAPPPTLEEIVRTAGAGRLWIAAPDLGRARSAMDRFPEATELELELADDSGLAAALEDGRLSGRKLVRAVAGTAEQAQRLLAIDATFEVVLLLTRQATPWLLGLDAAPSRLALRMPAWERLTESAERDVDLEDFFSRFRLELPLEDVPACVSGRPPRPGPGVLDTAMMTAEGRLEIFRYTKRYILDRYRTKSLRCKTCVHDVQCRGLHINYVRAHGYGAMRPVLAGEAESAA